MTGLFVFILCAVLLWAGYLFYGRFAEKVYGSSGPKVMPFCSSTSMAAWRVSSS